MFFYYHKILHLICESLIQVDNREYLAECEKYSLMLEVMGEVEPSKTAENKK